MNEKPSQCSEECMSSLLKLSNSHIQSGFHYRNVIPLGGYHPHKRQSWTKLRNLNSDRHSLCKHPLFMGYTFYIPLSLITSLRIFNHTISTNWQGPITLIVNSIINWDTKILRKSISTTKLKKILTSYKCVVYG